MYTYINEYIYSYNLIIFRNNNSNNYQKNNLPIEMASEYRMREISK